MMEFLGAGTTTDNFKIFDDVDIKKEMDILMKDETDFFSNFPIDDLDMKMEHDFDIKKESILDELDDFGSYSFGCRQDHWNSQNLWDYSSSNPHLDFIGGSPESAMMVNPNIVIPDGRLSYELHIREDEKENKINVKDNKNEVTSSLNPNLLANTEATTAISNNISSNKSDPVVVKESIAVRREFSSDNRIKEIRKKEFNLKINSEVQTKTTSLKTKSATKNRSANSKSSLLQIANAKTVRSQQPVIIAPKSSIPASKLINTDDFNSKKENVPMDTTIPKRIKIQAKLNNNNKIEDDIYDFYFQRKLLYPKPAFSYSCLITMALQNSKQGCLPVSEIYNFMCNHFPYFKTAPNGWKNSVRHNLSLNKCFEKIEKPPGSTRKGCLWSLSRDKIVKMGDEVRKFMDKDRDAIRRCMIYPEHLELLEKGELKTWYEEKDFEDTENEEDFDEEMDNGYHQNAQLSEIEGIPHSDIFVPDCDMPEVNLDDLPDLSEFAVDTGNQFYEELLGSIQNQPLFPVNNSTLIVASNIKTENVISSTNNSTVVKREEFLKLDTAATVAVSSSKKRISSTLQKNNIKISYLSPSVPSAMAVHSENSSEAIVLPTKTTGVHLQNTAGSSGGFSYQEPKKIVSKFEIQKNSGLLNNTHNKKKEVDWIRTIRRSSCDRTHVDEDYDINNLLRFHNVSTKGQHHTARYIAANKPVKNIIKSNNSVARKKFFST